MKYYVVADVHGFYTELYNELEEKGFFKDIEPHKLIVCGDLFDRGDEALKLQSFIMELIVKNEVILIRGNHEDLLLTLIKDWDNNGFLHSHHNSNGTVDTVLQLTETKTITVNNKEEVKEKIINTPFVKEIIPRIINYYETEKYVFVHGWIPCDAIGFGGHANRFIYKENWRELEEVDWNFARWYNGMEAARQGVIEPNKTIVCGHWHCSYGHAKIEGEGSEFGEDANFNPYISKGIIAIDACTVSTKKINCLVVDD